MRHRGFATLSSLNAARVQIVEAVSVPVIADADTGYGNALNVRRTVREFERHGVAAIHIEDQVTPKRCGHYDDKELISTAEMVGKVRAAVEARDEMLIIARTDAIATSGLDSALERANLYSEAGADAVFIEAPETEDQIETIAAEVDAPLVINMLAGGKTPLIPRKRLEELGFRLMIVPSDIQRAAIKAMQEATETLLADGETTAMADRMVTFREREQLVTLDDYRKLETRYAAESQDV